MLIRVLGPVDVVLAGRTLELPLLERSLLAVLSARMGMTVSTDRLIDALWSDDPPRSARNRVQALVSSVRRTLDGAGDRILVTAAPGYRLDGYSDVVDAGRFQRLVQLARDHMAAQRPDEAAAVYRAALDLWRGVPFEGTRVRDTDLQAEAARLDESRLAAAEEGIDAELALRRHGQIIPELTSLVTANPFRERLRGQLMLALARSGRQSEALAVYRSGYDLFAAELGLEPGPALRQLHMAILSEDSAQWRADDAAEGPPPGRTTISGTAVRAVGMPADLPDFIGRAEELTRLRLLFGAPGGRPGVVIISGMGGVGKTSLALRLAHVAMREYVDGCLYLDLRGTDESPPDVHQVMGAALRALGVSEAAIPEDRDRRTAVYGSTLAQRQLLLVLDDAVDETQVRGMIPAASRSALLVTSRRTFTGIAGARVLDLDVLGAADALALLTHLIGPARAVDEEVAASRIVELCGRLPLAIRIIGVRLARQPELRLAQVVDRLAAMHHRLDELAVDDRTVRASIELSYGRLDPTAARLLRLLGLLPVTESPGWIAAALLDEPAYIADAAVARLVDASLVSIGYAASEARYRVHDLVRLYGQDRANSDDASDDHAAALRRLYEGLLRLAEEANAALLSSSFPTPPIPPDWWSVAGASDLPKTAPLDWFDTEHGLLVGAIRDAVRRGWVDLAWRLVAMMTVEVSYRGGIDDWCRLVDLVLAELPGGTGEHEAQARPLLLLGLGGLLRGRGHARGSLAHLRQARIGFRRLGDEHRAGVAACQFGMAARPSNPRLADAAFRWATARIDPTQGGHHLALAHVGMGNVRLDAGDHEGAGRAYRLALDALRGHPDLATEANALTCLGIVARREGRVDEALAHSYRALDILIQIGDRANAGRVELALAETYVEHGDLFNARAFGDRARLTMLDVADIVGEAGARAVLGRVALAEGRPSEATGELEDACARLEKAGHPVALARALTFLGQARLALNDRAGARDAGETARDIYAEHGRAEAPALTEWLADLDPGPAPAPTD